MTCPERALPDAARRISAAIPELLTPRLRLRAPAIADLPPLQAMLESPRAQFIGGPYPADRTHGFLAAEAGCWLLYGFGYWSVEARATGALLGSVGLCHIPEFPERELGWMLLPSAEGQGFAQEAGAAARDYAFGPLGWPTLVSYIHPQNARSIRVAKALGAKHEPQTKGPEPGDLVFRHPKPAPRNPAP
ncbi:MAG: GNAT family N-acetyltransferase [Pseudomonadota bacterium]